MYAATEAAKSSCTRRSMGSQPSRPKRSFTRAISRRIASRYVTYSGIVCRDGSSRARMPTRPTASGDVSRRRSNASTPRTTFFDGSVRSTRSTIRSGRPSSSRRSASSTGGLDASSSNSCGSIEIGCAATVVRASAVRAQHLGGRLAEGVGPALGVEGDDVVRDEAGVDRPAHRLRQHAPAVGRRPRDVREVREERVAALVADDERSDVEVVVVEEDRRVRPLCELLEHRDGEGVVDRDVAVLPGAVRARRRGRSSSPHRSCWRNQSVGFATTL